MHKGQSALTIFTWVCLLNFTGPLINNALGVQPKTKEQGSTASTVKIVRPSSGQPQKPGKIASSLESQRSPKAALASPRQKALIEIKSKPSKGKLSVKAHKKSMPKAVVQPRTDLIHYGMLEDSQRYDPRPHTDSAAVRSPQTLELTHDHFQELDRNQDGMIDPVERAFGRIDMDRDLHTRTLH